MSSFDTSNGSVVTSYAKARADTRLAALEERITRFLGAPGEKAQA